MFSHPLYLLHFLEAKYYIRSPDLLQVVRRLVWHEPSQIIKVGWISTKEAFFVVIGWYMPYFHLFPFVFSEKYGEVEISRVVIFVYVYHFIAILICTYSLSSGYRLIIINHCFVWRCLTSFHLTSFLVPCLIFCILVILGWSLKKARLTVYLHTASKPFRRRLQLMRWVV